MQNPKVSVVITTYNRADFLCCAIESVLNQTFQDFELIIIDDGSTDNTVEIVQNYIDPRIRYYYQNNSGQNPSRNMGMKLSRGEYITHLDSDDMMVNTKLEKQVKILDKDPEIGVVYCGTELINKDNIPIGRRSIANVNGYVLGKLLLSNFLYNGSNPMFRKSCLEKSGYFDANFWRMTDWEFYLRLAIYFNFWSIPEYLLKYRVHDKTMSCDFNGYEENGLNIIEKIFSNKDFPIRLKYLKSRALACRHRYMARRYYENAIYEEAFKYILKTVNTDWGMIFDLELLKLIILISFPKFVVEYIRLASGKVQKSEKEINT